MAGRSTPRIFQSSFRFFFLILILIISTEVNHKVSAMKGFYFGKTIQSANTVRTIRSFAGVSIEECTDECRKRAHCHYVDYLTRFKVCYILNTTDPNEDFEILYQNKTGSVVGVKSKWITDTETKADQVSSLECYEPKDIPNATRTGNIYTCGSKVLSQCLDYSDHAFLTCTANGTWEPSIEAGIPCVRISYPWIVGRSYYYMLWDKMTWEKAKARCEHLHGHLADITNQTVQNAFEDRLKDFLAKSKIKNDPYDYKLADWMYISVNDRETEGVFKLSDGSNLTYENWNENEPNSEPGEDCVVMSPHYHYHWADVQCNDSYLAICEYDFSHAADDESLRCQSG